MSGSQSFETKFGPVSVGVVGATGMGGTTLLNILPASRLQIEELRLFGSDRSTGMILEYGEDEIEVEDSASANFEGIDLMFLMAGSDASRQLAPIAAKAGALVVDNSSAWRQHPEVPLVVPEVNPHALDHIPYGIVANPNCSTIMKVVALKPLHDMAELEKTVVTTFQATSGVGRRGIEELCDQLIDGRRAYSPQDPNNVFPEMIAGNIIPLRGKLDPGTGITSEEKKLFQETQRIMELATYSVSATCSSAPVRVGHSLSIEAKFRDPIFADEAEERLSHAPGVKLVDIPSSRRSVGIRDILVGRIRQSGVFDSYGLSLWVAGDNLHKGAGQNAIQIAELLAMKRFGSVAQ